jgi:uncharacterized protein YjbI with pentapeptide repeats
MHKNPLVDSKNASTEVSALDHTKQGDAHINSQTNMLGDTHFVNAQQASQRISPRELDCSGVITGEHYFRRRFSGIVMEDLIFENCHFEECHWNQVDIKRCQFLNCEWKSTHLEDTTWERCEWNMTSVNGGFWLRGQWIQGFMSDVILNDMSVIQMVWRGCVFQKLGINQVNFEGSYWERSYLQIHDTPKCLEGPLRGLCCRVEIPTLQETSAIEQCFPGTQWQNCLLGASS